MRDDTAFGIVMCVLALLFFIGFAVVTDEQHIQAATAPPWVDCKKFAPMTLVKDYDGRLWLVDICAVAQDDAGASQYKSEVKTK